MYSTSLKMDPWPVVSQASAYKYADFGSKVNLGRGEFGIVYGATHPTIPQVAIRILSRNFHATENERQALLKEASLLRAIQSPQLLSLYGTVMETEHLCLVFEYAEYGSLCKVLRRVKIQWPMKIVFAYEIALGMAYLHGQDVLHLRLKSSNVLICENMNVKLADMNMGIGGRMSSWSTQAMTYSRTQPNNTRLDTPANVANFPPEILLDINFPPGKATDVYAFGIILWQIITDKIPYDGKKSEEVCALVKNGERPTMIDIPADKPEILDRLMKKSWDQNRESRPSFTAIRVELESVYAGNRNLAMGLKQQYQEVLNDFNIRDNLYISAPISDMSMRSRRRYQADGSVTSVMLTEGRCARATTETETLTLTETRQQHQSGGAATAIIPSEDISGTQQQYHSDGAATAMIDNEITTRKGLPLIPPEYRDNEPANEDKDEDAPVIPNTLFPLNNESKQKLYIVAEELGSRHWRRFGHCLGFSDGEMDNIQTNYSSNGYPEISYQMLRRWCERECRDTIFDDLKRLLSDNGFDYIALKMDQQ